MVLSISVENVMKINDILKSCAGMGIKSAWIFSSSSRSIA
jgi:hypothetical protein